jgi:hypothetical protein
MVVTFERDDDHSIKQEQTSYNGGDIFSEGAFLFFSSFDISSVFMQQ